ncbi:MAG TPA: hypothetical protein VGA72_04495 [Anaerolineales bacterium]
MKTTEKQASKRLFKKLSALRATLSNEERKILDELIVTEVAAHRMNVKAADRAISRASTKASEVAAHKMTTKAADRAVSRASTKASEVAAHKMTTKATDRAISKASEVAAHKMNTKAADRAISKASTKAISKSTFRIAFDPNSEEYKVQD